MIAVVMALGAGACSNEEASGGSDDSKKGTSSAAAHAPKTLTEAQLKAVAFTEGQAVGEYTASPYTLDGPLSDAYTADPARCQPLVSLAGEVSDYDPAAQVQRRVDIPEEMLGITIDVTLRSYTNGDAADVMKALGRAGKGCAGGFTEERAIARAKYLKVEPAKAPDFAAEADGVKAYRFTVRDVKEKSELYEYLTVVRSGSTTLAFRGETTSTEDIGGIPQDVMAEQWRKFRAS
ncbi:hypothetical protein [Streptomyces sp. NBC_01320]|uniref:hypothetical protein n=1 Tax=Streptomyces sp. NBC_01320 TaxID=2903824 RepID=UPI002E148A8C|nr:hypothetical protein OG395_19265 [Streptomyces sp. NBC_01320]